MKRYMRSIFPIMLVFVLLTGCGNNSGNMENEANGGGSAAAGGDKKITVLVESGSPAETVAKSTAAILDSGSEVQVVMDKAVNAFRATPTQDNAIYLNCNNEPEF